MQTKTNDVEKQIFLENENEELSEKVNELMNNKEIIVSAFNSFIYISCQQNASFMIFLFKFCMQFFIFILN
jgi:hypothetical protein